MPSLRNAVHLVVALATIALLASCSGSHGVRPSPAPGASESSGPTPTASSNPTPSPTAELWAAIPAALTGPLIAAPDVTASLPAVRDGRRLWPEGASGGLIIVNAEQAVPPVPGEPVGQGPSRYDQQFLGWDPVTGVFETLWANGSSRREDVLGVDGDWALALLYKNNPGSQWELRLHNLATGEQQTVDAENQSLRGLTPVGGSSISSGRVFWVTAAMDGNDRVEQLRMFNIATGATRVIESAPLRQWPAASFTPGGGSGGTIAFLRALPGQAATVVMRSLAGGPDREIAAPAGTTWEAISPDARFGIAGVDDGPRIAVNLKTGEPTRFGFGRPRGYAIDFARDYVSWQVSADPGRATQGGFYGFDSKTWRSLDPALPVHTQGARVFDGWFFWPEFRTDPQVGDWDLAPGRFQFMRLP